MASASAREVERVEVELMAQRPMSEEKSIYPGAFLTIKRASRARLKALFEKKKCVTFPVMGIDAVGWSARDCLCLGGANCLEDRLKEMS